jgi:hypothetical protein
MAKSVNTLSPVAAAILERATAEQPQTAAPVAHKDTAAPNKAKPSPLIVQPNTKRVTAGVDQRVNLTITSEAKGTVLAERFFSAVKDQGNELRGFLKQIAQLSLEGHTAFQAKLAAHRKEANEYVNGRKGRDGNANRDPVQAMRPAFKPGSDKAREANTIARSGFTRISEAIRFSMACAKGYKVEDWTASYHVLVVKARTFYDKAIGKNRKPVEEQTPVEKALAYIERMGLTKRQIHSLVAKLDSAD